MHVAERAAMQHRASRAIVLTVAVAALALAPRIASAQDVSLSIAESAKAAVARAVMQSPQQEQTLSPARQDFPRFSPTLQSLYFTTAVVQGLDAVTTFKALDHGGIEVNSLVKPFATHRPAFIALKAAMTTALIYQGHQMSKRHKIGAIIILGAVNSIYAAIAANNLHVIHTMQAQGR